MARRWPTRLLAGPAVLGRASETPPCAGDNRPLAVVFAPVIMRNLSWQHVAAAHAICVAVLLALAALLVMPASRVTAQQRVRRKPTDRAAVHQRPPRRGERRARRRSRLTAAAAPAADRSRLRNGLRPRASRRREARDSGDPPIIRAAQRRQRVPPEARRDNHGGGAARAGTAVAAPAGPATSRRRRPRQSMGMRVVRPRGLQQLLLLPAALLSVRVRRVRARLLLLRPVHVGSRATGIRRIAAFRGYGYGYPTGELRLDVDTAQRGGLRRRLLRRARRRLRRRLPVAELEEGTYQIEIVAPGFAPLSSTCGSTRAARSPIAGRSWPP